MVADHRRMKAAKLREEFASRLELVSPIAAAQVRADPPLPPAAVPSSYQRTPEEDAMVATLRAKQGPQHCLPQWTPSEDSYGRVTFTADHPDQELALARTMAALVICSEPAFFLFLDLVVEQSREMLASTFSASIS
jgi:hypothetical protein